MAVVLGVPGVAASSGGEAAKVAPGGVAVITRPSGGEIQLAMKQFDRRNEQVRAERRELGVRQDGTVGEEGLRQILEEADIEAEASEMEIVVGDRQTARALRRIKLRDFSSIRQFQTYLRRVRITEAEARERVRIQLLLRRIENHVTAGVSKSHRAAALRRFVNVYLRRWRSRTVCRPGLATERCSNGPPLASTAEAGFGAVSAHRRSRTVGGVS